MGQWVNVSKSSDQELRSGFKYKVTLSRCQAMPSIKASSRNAHKEATSTLQYP